MKIYKKVSVVALLTLFGSAVYNGTAIAADNNEINDPPIRPDPVGNALIGGAVTGSMKGAAAGAASSVRGASVGGAIDSAKQSINENRSRNAESGRGGSNDPRYNPGTLFDK